MKRILILVSFFFMLPVFISAQDEQADMMKAWQESMTPGPMHKMLAKAVGEWKAEITSWNDPSSPPSISTGTSSWDTVLGGRYVQGKHTASFMGMEMQGLETTGYDNVKKKFFSTWLDNFGTGILYQEGEYDEATKTFTYHGNMTDPLGNEMKVRQTNKFLDDDTAVMEMYMVDRDKEFKSMEIKFTRIK